MNDIHKQLADYLKNNIWWMEKNKYDSRIKLVLRKLFLQSDLRSSKLKEARVQRGKYVCVECGELFDIKSVQVHHINEVKEANDYNEYIELLFCDPDDLMVVCKNCHYIIHQK